VPLAVLLVEVAGRILFHINVQLFRYLCIIVSSNEGVLPN